MDDDDKRNVVGWASLYSFDVFKLNKIQIFVSQVTRQVAQCKCAKRFQVEQIGENKYRVRIWSQILLVKQEFKF